MFITSGKLSVPSGIILQSTTWLDPQTRHPRICTSLTLLVSPVSTTKPVPESGSPGLPVLVVCALQSNHLIYSALALHINPFSFHSNELHLWNSLAPPLTTKPP